MIPQFSIIEDGFELHVAGRLMLRHSASCPALTVARGDADVTMVRGNFRIADRPSQKVTPIVALVEPDRVELLADGKACALLSIGRDGALLVESVDPAHDRLWLRFHAAPGEAVWGGGEQMSYLALGGRAFPVWTSEPGVGRDKSTALTRIMDEEGMAGGDYWNSNYPQPTFLTSRWIAVHLAESCYSVLDFTDPAHHQIEVWRRSARFEFFAADAPAALVTALSDRFGRQPPLPDWAIGGAIVGLKDGIASFDRLENFLAAGAAVSGLWCEDWAGVRQTSFGRRLFWDWRRSEARYPDLPDRIAALAARGIRFLAYANPYLAVDGSFFAEAQAAGHFALRPDGDTPYLVDFGEFDCGVLDFTRKETRDWTGRDFAPGRHDVPAPIGRPPLFYRLDSSFAAVFAMIAEVAK